MVDNITKHLEKIRIMQQAVNRAAKKYQLKHPNQQQQEVREFINRYMK